VIISGNRMTFPVGNKPMDTFAGDFVAFAQDLNSGQSRDSAVNRFADKLGIIPAQSIAERKLDECLTSICAYEAVRLAAVRPSSLSEIANWLFPKSEATCGAATQGLLRALIIARNAQELAPLPLRAHFFFHNAGRLWACINPNCTAEA